jgi:type VI protein secretion system component VasF
VNDRERHEARLLAWLIAACFVALSVVAWWVLS